MSLLFCRAPTSIPTLNPRVLGFSTRRALHALMIRIGFLRVSFKGVYKGYYKGCCKDLV